MGPSPGKSRLCKQRQDNKLEATGNRCECTDGRGESEDFILGTLPDTHKNTHTEGRVSRDAAGDCGWAEQISSTG